MGASSLQSLPGSVTFMEWGLATSPEMLAGEAGISSHRPAQAEGLPENTDHTPWQVEKETDASDNQDTVQRKDTGEVEDVVLQGA